MGMKQGVGFSFVSKVIETVDYPSHALAALRLELTSRRGAPYYTDM